MAKHGIDVSAHQRGIDWAKVKASGKVDFVILKTGGSDAGIYKDGRYEFNYSQCKKYGIPVGAYYFVGQKCTTVDAGVADAKRFLEHLKGKQFEYPVYIDVEAPIPATRKGNTDATVAFIQTVQNAGYWVGVYASTWSGFASRLDDSRLQPYAHWVAQYASSCEYTGKVGIGIWQYSSKGSISGINGDVDMDYCYVDYPTKIKAKGLNGFKKTTSTTTAKTTATEATIRAKAVSLANSYIGCVCGDSKHKKIIDTFNTVQPDGWPMNYTAAWCATFVSAIAILQFGKDKAKKYFPLSANCRGIIDGAKERGIWIENDAYVPSPGDWIIYDWEDNGVGDDTRGYDHVGIVKEVKNGNIIVIEGNKHNKCAYRDQAVDGLYTRGFVHPNYAAAGGVTSTTPQKQTTTSTAKKTTIKVDGDWGKQTTKALQKKLGTYQDGKVSNQLTSCKKYLMACNTNSWEFYANPKGNSAVIVALQKKIGVTADGYMGYYSVRTLQQFLNRQINAGLDVDGYCGKKTVKALQTWINK